MPWQVEILDHRVERELDALPTGVRAKLDQIIHLIEDFGPRRVGAPHVKFLRDGLWEIRADSHDGHGRVLFVREKEDRLITLYAFLKKTRRTPIAAIKIAKARLRTA